MLENVWLESLRTQSDRSRAFLVCSWLTGTILWSSEISIRLNLRWQNHAFAFSVSFQRNEGWLSIENFISIDGRTIFRIVVSCRVDQITCPIRASKIGVGRKLLQIRSVLESILLHPLINETSTLSLFYQEIPISAGQLVRWIYLVQSLYADDLVRLTRERLSQTTVMDNIWRENDRMRDPSVQSTLEKSFQNFGHSNSDRPLWFYDRVLFLLKQVLAR
jgi:hypothetical protein